MVSFGKFNQSKFNTPYIAVGPVFHIYGMAYDNPITAGLVKDGLNILGRIYNAPITTGIVKNRPRVLGRVYDAPRTY